MASFDPIRAFDSMDPLRMLNKLEELKSNEKRKTIGTSFSPDPTNPSLKTRIRFAGKTESGDPVLTAIKGFMLLGKPEEAMALIQHEIQKGQVIFESVVVEEGKQKVYAVTSPEINDKFKTGKYKLLGVKDGSLHQYDGISTIGAQKFAEIAKLTAEKLKLKTDEKTEPQNSVPKAPIAPLQDPPMQVPPQPQSTIIANPAINPDGDPDIDMELAHSEETEATTAIPTPSTAPKPEVPSNPQPVTPPPSPLTGAVFEPTTTISVQQPPIAPAKPLPNPIPNKAPEEKPKTVDLNGALSAPPTPAISLPPNQAEPVKVAPELKPASAILEALDQAEIKGPKIEPKPQPEIKK